ncbi:MAG: PT domain-containing protein, partial [Chloroflexota bacterium]
MRTTITGKLTMTLSKKWLALLIVAVLLGVSAPITAQDITETPSPEPTLIEPTATPTDMPTLEPTVAPTEVATDIPTELPTEQPTLETPVEVTDEATIEPTEEATTEVTEVATETPVATIGVEETPVVEPTLSVTEVDPEPALQLLERELFDNLPDAAVWSIPASASLTEGQVGQGLQLAADENTSTESLALITPYQDVVVQADFKLQSGEARLNTRANDTTSYSAGLSADAVTLYQGSEILLSTPLTLDLSLWHTLRLSTIGNVVRVSVDDVEWIVARQNTSLESGTASISGTETGNLLVDNIFVWIPESVIETTPMTVTPEATQTDEIVAQTTNQGAMLFNTTYSRSMSADGHRWTWYFDQTYPNWLLDIQPTSGNLRYQIVLVGPSGTYSTRSSDNGRGILWRPPSTTAGNYYVDLIPYAGYSSGNYNITIWSCCKPKIRADWGTQYGWSTTNQWYIENTSSGQQYIRMQVEPGYSMTYNWSLYGATDSATPNGAIYATGNGASNLTIVPISLPAGGYHFNFNVVSGGGSYMIGLYSGAPYTSVPGSFSVGSLNTTGGTLTWTDTSGNEDGYRVYRRTPGNGWGNPIATLGANATSYNDTTATCGAQYEYMVSSYNWNGQANSAGQTVTIPFCPPVNDNRANAEIISTFTTLVGRSPNGATTEGVDANLCAAVTHTIWYRFTPTTSGPITINTVGSNYDTVLAVFLAGDNYYQVCNDDANPPNQSSSLWLDVQAGQTYEIVVGKYGSNATTTGHSLTLDVRTPPAVSTPVVLRSPAAGSFSMYPNVVLAIVPNAACSMFEFQLSTAANFTSILDQWVYAPDPNNINATAALNDGLYFWRARCRGLTGGAGPWSAGRSFTVDTVATGSPTLTAPLDGSIQPSLRPTAKWDVVPGSNRYSVEIATDADFINTLSFPTTMVETTATTFVLPPLPGQGQFWVRVYAKDAAG